jgi:hypothetical protein
MLPIRSEAAWQRDDNRSSNGAKLRLIAME